MKKLNLSLSIFTSLLAFNCSIEESTSENTNTGFQVNAGDLQGSISSGSVTLNASETYILTGALIVKEGAVLTIPSGTTITAAAGTSTSAYIGVERGAKIYINGTATAPVVMTSETQEAGSWGGLAIAGYGITNAGTNVTSEVGDLTYGGSDNSDNSGVVTYLRVEYTGATFTNEKEFNGVTLFGVGSGTTFSNVSSVNGGDDGIEFFGGAVNAKNLVSINSGDDSIDFADGFVGSIEGAYIKGITKAGIEGSNNGDNGDATPVTSATVSNVTMVVDGLGNSEGAIYFKEGGGNISYNNIIVDGVSLGMKIKSSDAAANARLANGDLVISNFNYANEPSAWSWGGYGYIGTNSGATGAGNGTDSPAWASGWSE
jgi:hypothetical protein|tara:strand:+ start:41 stop:1159 length:1119 start_codon:yes stop_codon:yes gene_type:complete